MNEDLEKLIEKSGMTDDELKQLLRQAEIPQIKNRNSYRSYQGTGHIKIGVMGDVHAGSNKFREDLFLYSAKKWKQENVTSIYSIGDLCEGMSGRDGHIWENKINGISNQANYLCELLQEFKKPIKFILGNHDLWSMKKGNQGFNVGEYISSKVKDCEYLGDLRADLIIDDSLKIRLTHEGSSAYALSYSLQKRINGLEGGTKPHILLNGHLHKMLSMYYRNIWAFECGTYQEQTDFMAEKGSPAMLGFYTLDLAYNKKGLTEINQIVHTFY